MYKEVGDMIIKSLLSNIYKIILSHVDSQL